MLSIILGEENIRHLDRSAYLGATRVKAGRPSRARVEPKFFTSPLIAIAGATAEF